MLAPLLSLNRQFHDLFNGLNFVNLIPEPVSFVSYLGP